METLRAAASILGPLIGLLGLITGFYYFRRSRKYKELTYDVFPTLSLVQVGSAIKGKVRVEYDGEPIEDLSGVSVEIRSSGTEPIAFSWKEAGTTETPVTLDFEEGARILGEPTVESTPKHVKASVVKDPESSSRVILDKFLLNPGQSVTVSTFLTNYSGETPKVYAQIKGVPPLRGRTAVETVRAQERARLTSAVVYSLPLIVVLTSAYVVGLSLNKGFIGLFAVFIASIFTIAGGYYFIRRE